MLRLSRLIRPKALPKHIATRSGLPNWDRPDPPPSATVPDDHEFTDEQMVFFFPDRNMPEYVLSQPEVYEGDTVMQSMPMFAKGWAAFFGLAGLFAFTNYITNTLKSYNVPTQENMEKYEISKEMTQSKQWYKWASINPLGLVINNDTYPNFKPDMTSQNVMQHFDENYRKNEQVIKEVKTYLTGVKQRAQQKVNKKGHGHEHKQAHKH